jgi:hypothetical protein
MTDDQQADKFDRYGALYLLCSRWHSGQWSRGYRILSRLTVRGYRPGLSVQQNRFESEQQRAYYRHYYRLRHTL